MSIIEKEPKTERNRFTRMCIGEAVVELMKKNEYDKIKVSDIVKKAGVSRMTYYHYYGSKDEVLEDYLSEIIQEYISKREQHGINKKFYHCEQMLFTLNFFDRYSAFILGMAKSGFYSIMINAINKYMEEHLLPQFNKSKYELYYYAGALLNIFIKWEEEGKKITAEELAKTIECFN